jgi:hypothetical protein
VGDSVVLWGGVGWFVWASSVGGGSLHGCSCDVSSPQVTIMDNTSYVTLSNECGSAEGICL